MNADNDTRTTPGSVTRRDFLRTSTAAVVAGTVASQLAPAVYAQGDDVIRVGLVGCGGRGTGAAAQALTADPNTQLVAMADAFADRLEGSLNGLKGTEVADRVLVDDAHKFVGMDAYQSVIDSDVDVVLLCTPPGFRPMHLRACVDAGKHVFAEKPVATDAPGVRSVLESAEAAKAKNLTILSGLCWRYETGMQETIRRIQDGQIGRVIAVESTRFGSGVGKGVVREPGWSGMYYQVRNWYYYAWLSGDFNVEQFVHELDKIAWMLGEYPSSCLCSGGRQSRTGPEYGHIYDHFAAVYDFPSGVKYFASTRHQPGDGKHFDFAMGTDGNCDLMGYAITGKNPWSLGQGITQMHQLEQNALFAALRKGEIINDGEFMAKSTLMGIMARMSAYTGKTLTWDEALNSQENLLPADLSLDADVPEPPVAVPGITQFR